MCEPTTLAITAFAIQAGSSYLKSVAQNQAADANGKQAVTAANLQYRDLSIRQVQESQAAERQIQQAQVQTQSAIAVARTASAESGVAGASVDALLGDYSRQGADYADSVRVNRDNTVQQLQREKAGVKAQAASRIASVPRANPWATGFEIAGAGVGLANRLESRKPVVS